MLEHHALLICCAAPSGMRRIVDADSGAPLGHARWEHPRRPWWCPISRSVLAVHEYEDEPLLFTVRRCWSLLPRREVLDAEGASVGFLVGPLVYDCHGRQVAMRHKEIGATVHSYCTPYQRTLMEVSCVPKGGRLAFSTNIAGEPFLKMLLLAAALMEEEKAIRGRPQALHLS
jgi:hypothetical protein